MKKTKLQNKSSAFPRGIKSSRKILDKIIITSLFAAIIIGSLSFCQVSLAADSIFSQANSGLQTMIQQAYGGQEVNKNSFMGGLLLILNHLLTFLGILFFLGLIYAGHLWMTARGNEEQADKAKKITREIVIGIIIILLSRIFTEFIIYQINLATKTATS